MINEKTVKQFFLETNRWIAEENSRLISQTHFHHSCSLLYDIGRLNYIDVWSEGEEKNVIKSIGYILIWHQDELHQCGSPLWGMNYDGQYKKDYGIALLRKEGLIKTFREIDRQWEQTIVLKKNGLEYQNKINGPFSLFDLEEIISADSKCVSRYRYRSRALVNLSS